VLCAVFVLGSRVVRSSQKGLQETEISCPVGFRSDIQFARDKLTALPALRATCQIFLVLFNFSHLIAVYLPAKKGRIAELNRLNWVLKLEFFCSFVAYRITSHVVGWRRRRRWRGASG
jgi:hypothetical protein